MPESTMRPAEASTIANSSVERWESAPWPELPDAGVWKAEAFEVKELLFTATEVTMVRSYCYQRYVGSGIDNAYYERMPRQIQSCTLALDKFERIIATRSHRAVSREPGGLGMVRLIGPKILSRKGKLGKNVVITIYLKAGQDVGRILAAMQVLMPNAVMK